MRTAAILPVKRFARAKQRLGVSVADPLHGELVPAMVADVLLALAHTAAIERTIVVTGEPSVADAAQRQGALVIEDTREDGQSAAITLGVHGALAHGFQRVLCIPGDCPALDPTELELLLREPTAEDSAARATAGSAARSGAGAAPEAGVVIVPDRHGSGTNGLLLSPPDVIAPSFGTDSCRRHMALARAAGVTPRLQRPASLLLDIDTGADLAALQQRLAGSARRAERTRAVLSAGDRGEELSIASAG